MKIIFLDVDGVINAIDSIAIPPDTFYFEGEPFSAGALNLLKKLAEEAPAEIVLSSGWRLEKKNYQIIERLLKLYNLEIFDVTPRLYSRGSYIPFHLLEKIRSKEIGMWLTENNSIKEYVILDDLILDTLCFPAKDHFVQTNPLDGFLPSDFQEAAKILGLVT